ncbi:MAG: metalloregulator ArsR/SmtB family transcription factor [Pseudomonadota bacterium]
MQQATEQLLSHFKALADPLRLRLFVLLGRGECSVSELTEVTGLSQPRVSQHLKQLADTGLIERFRDGQFAYYRAPEEGARGSSRRRLMALLPADEPAFDEDAEALQKLRGNVRSAEVSAADRALYRALVELTVSAPIGDLLDIGSGEGRILKLLGSRARRAVGVDTNPDARRLARADLLLAGLPNCSLRQGSMYKLPFAAEEFDTVILDDVLGDSARPEAALAEARRILRPAGRLLILSTAGGNHDHDVAKRLAAWCAHSGLRVTPPRVTGAAESGWLLAVATHAPTRDAAA